MIHALALLASTVLLASQDGPRHADLHPADADVFLEIGPVKPLLAALDGAPLVGFLRDARVAPLLEELGYSPTRTLAELLKENMQQQPGGDASWADGLGTVSVSLRARETSAEWSAFEGLLVAELDTPEQAAQLRANVVAGWSGEKTTEPPGIDRLQAPDWGGVWCTTLDARFVLARASVPVEETVARIEKKTAGLGGREDFQKRIASFEKGEGVPVLWFALARPLTEIVGGETSSVINQIPADLNPLGSARVARMRFTGQRFVTEIVSSEPSGASANAVDPAWLAPAPSDALFLYASAFDGAGAATRLRELLTQDESAAATLAAVEEKLGYGPERVLGHLGPALCAYSGPLAGLGLPAVTAWLDCDDPEAFRTECEALVGALAEGMPGFEVKTKPYRIRRPDSDERVEVPITTLSLPPGLIQVPMVNVSPSFAAVDGKLVFTLNSIDLKGELKRRVAGTAGEESLLATQGWKIPADARTVFVMDWGRLLGGLVATAKALGPMFGKENLPFDLAKLPGPEVFTEHFRPTLLVAKNIDGGIYRRNEASFGPETWLRIAWLVGQMPDLPDQAAAPSGGAK